MHDEQANPQNAVVSGAQGGEGAKYCGKNIQLPRGVVNIFMSAAGDRRSAGQFGLLLVRAEKVKTC